MTDAMVSVFPDKRACGWPRWPHGTWADVVTIGVALSRAYTTDAHFCAYETPNGRRLTTKAIDCGKRVAMNVAVFDVDCPEVHGTSTPAPDAWRAQFLEQVAELERVHPEPFVYATRGGARIVYMLAEPFVVSTQATARRWSQDYATAAAYLERRFGIDADRACKDWQRFYRLPRATRVVGGKPEHWPTHGDTSRIGALTIDAATEADVARGQRNKRKKVA